MAMEMPPEVKLEEGEGVEMSVEGLPGCRILLTNRRLIVWERREGVEQITPVALEHLAGVEVREEKMPMVWLLAGLGLAVVGALFLPYLESAGTQRENLLSLALGALGVGLVVAGLFTLSLYLRQAFFPLVLVTFPGAPQVVVRMPAESRRPLRELAQRLKVLRARLE